jgi:serine/threonine protein kinase
VKIGDLGFSKEVSKITSHSVKFVGTVNYMSPEIIMEDRKYTNKIDVWSLGCVIYELIKLTKLFDDKIAFNINKKIIEGKIVLPNDIDPKLGRILEG